jgi:hypothetical protein
MRKPRRPNTVAVALYFNAVLLFGVLVALLSGGRVPSLLPEAHAAPVAQPIAGGSGIYLMPGQMSLNTWGCYVMDVDAQTLCAYQYFPGANKLRLVAARNFRNDRRLQDFNTDHPSPAEVAKLLELEAAGRRDKPDADAQQPDAGADGAEEGQQ